MLVDGDSLRVSHLRLSRKSFVKDPWVLFCVMDLAGHRVLNKVDVYRVFTARRIVKMDIISAIIDVSFSCVLICFCCGTCRADPQHVCHQFEEQLKQQKKEEEHRHRPGRHSHVPTGEPGSGPPCVRGVFAFKNRALA